MDTSKYSKSLIGHLEPIEIVEGETRTAHVAYVPDPLPARMVATDEVVVLLESAMLALGRLDGIARRLPNPWLLARPAIRQEAVSSSSLEGTVSTLSDLFAADLIDEKEVPRDTREVRNYVRAAEQGIEALNSLPVCVRLTCNLHATLLSGVRGDSFRIGEVRQIQNWIGSTGSSITEAAFVPPPPGEVLREGLSEWGKWLNNATDVPLLLRVAASHYQFETLHPFDDGNGRLGRLVILLLLIQEGALSVPLLDVSTWLEARRDDYIGHLRQVSESGDFNPWFEFFLRCIKEQSEAAALKADGLLAVADGMAEELKAANVRGSALDIAQSLIEAPVLTVRSAADRTDKTYQAASNAIDRLVELGILEPWFQKRYPKMYWSPRVYGVMLG